MSEIITVEHLSKHFGGLKAVDDVSIHLNEGEILGLIGANGAGKTTTLRTIAGLKKPSSGSVLLKGQDITAATPRQRVQMGAAMVPEGRHVFTGMTVQENLEMGAFLRRDKRAIADDMEMVCDYFPILRSRRKQLAGTLSGGEQQMLAMGRALMSRPRLMMLDEPSMGLSPILVQQVFDIIKKLHEGGTTILLVEQNAEMALEIADRAYVLESGRIKLSGTGTELAASDEIKKAYLGG